MVLEKTLESPLDYKEIQPVHPKEDQFWVLGVRNLGVMQIRQERKEISPGISLERLMLKLKLQYFGHLMRRVESLEKTDAGRDWGQEEKGTTKDVMAGWHH